MLWALSEAQIEAILQNDDEDSDEFESDTLSDYEDEINVYVDSEQEMDEIVPGSLYSLPYLCHIHLYLFSKWW